MRKLAFIFISILFVLGGCAPQMSAVWQKNGYTERPFKKVAVFAINKNMAARSTLESEIVSGLEDLYPNTTFFKGFTYLPLTANKEDWTETKLKEILQINDFDAVIATSVVQSYTTKDYNSGDTMPMYYPRYYGVGPYFYNTYNTVYSPGYYEESDHYVLETTIFDLKEGNTTKKEIVWRGQSEVKNPSSISSGASSYAKNLVKYIHKHGVLK